MKKKERSGMGFIIEPSTLATSSTSISVSASGPWGEEEKEFLYPATVESANVTASLAHELGTKFKPKEKKQITEIIDHAKMYFSEFEVGFSLSLIPPKGEIKLKFKKEPKKTITVFQEID